MIRAEIVAGRMARLLAFAITGVHVVAGLVRQVKNDGMKLGAPGNNGSFPTAGARDDCEDHCLRMHNHQRKVEELGQVVHPRFAVSDYHKRTTFGLVHGDAGELGGICGFWEGGGSLHSSWPVGSYVRRNCAFRRFPL